MTPALLAITCLTAVTFCYIGVCAVSPFGRCRKCDGLGFQLAQTRKGRPKRGKHCRRCDGNGIRIRLGRHLYNLWARTYRNGTR
ncbi:hypothetical protein [Streptomyces sp. TRM49041]|uniref:hypothetical protein n=1 Tax=Streptomyces sp. TRM49041 TaxID=2603216 RepID=UPI0011EF38B3|nr:hypothetical protein [Streptomyces sp. TRM49041]